MTPDVEVVTCVIVESAVEGRWEGSGGSVPRKACVYARYGSQIQKDVVRSGLRFMNVLVFVVWAKRAVYWSRSGKRLPPGVLFQAYKRLRE